MNNKIACLIVVYNPNIDNLQKCVSSLIHQVDRILIVNNSTVSDSIDDKLNYSKIKIINNKANLGISKAQNIGIDLLINENFDFIVLSDQDTFFPENYVLEMLDQYLDISKVEKIAAMCPNFINIQNNKKYPMIRRKNFFRKKFFNDNKLNYVSETISSGMFVPVSVFEDIGKMNELLFIDWVDHEWCWKANNKEFKICINSDINIHHHLGQQNNYELMKGYPIFTLDRYYYIFRNGFYLALFSKFIPMSWRINIFFTVIKYIFGFLVIEKFNFKYCLVTINSIYDGFTKKMGKNNKFDNV